MEFHSKNYFIFIFPLPPMIILDYILIVYLINQIHFKFLEFANLQFHRLIANYVFFNLL